MYQYICRTGTKIVEMQAAVLQLEAFVLLDGK